MAFLNIFTAVLIKISAPSNTMERSPDVSGTLKGYDERGF